MPNASYLASKKLYIRRGLNYILVRKLPGLCADRRLELIDSYLPIDEDEVLGRVDRFEYIQCELLSKRDELLGALKGGVLSTFLHRRVTPDGFLDRSVQRVLKEFIKMHGSLRALPIENDAVILKYSEKGFFKIFSRTLYCVGKNQVTVDPALTKGSGAYRVSELSGHVTLSPHVIHTFTVMRALIRQLPDLKKEIFRRVRSGGKVDFNKTQHGVKVELGFVPHELENKKKFERMLSLSQARIARYDQAIRSLYNKMDALVALWAKNPNLQRESLLGVLQESKKNLDFARLRFHEIAREVCYKDDLLIILTDKAPLEMPYLKSVSKRMQDQFECAFLYFRSMESHYNGVMADLGLEIPSPVLKVDEKIPEIPKENTFLEKTPLGEEQYLIQLEC